MTLVPSIFTLLAVLVLSLAPFAPRTAFAQPISLSKVDFGMGVPPTITSQPTNQTAVAGAQARFTVAVAGDEPLSYQWFYYNNAVTDDARYSGATLASLSISNVQDWDAGNYMVSISNTFGAVTSEVATLTVLQLPTITRQPVGRSVPAGLETTFSSSASGSIPLSYQWQLNGADIPGATSGNLTLPAVGTNDLGAYQLVVTNPAGVVTSAVAMLTFGPVAAWGNNNVGQSLPPPGLSNVIAVAAEYNYSLALRADGTVIAWGISAATNLPPELNNVVAISADSSYALALRSDGSVVHWGGTTAPFIHSGLSNCTSVAAGYHSVMLRSDGTVSGWDRFSFQPIAVPPNLTKVAAIDSSFLWSIALRENGTVLSWSSSATQLRPPAFLTNAVAVSAGDYHFLALTDSGTVVVWGGGFSIDPPAGLTNVISIEAGDDGSSFGVRSDGTVAAWGGLAAITNVPTGVSNVVAISASRNHCLALENDGRPLILRPPVGGTVFTGRDLILKTAVAGAAPLSYQWHHDGTNLPTATNGTLFIPNIQPGDAGDYQLIVSNALGVAASIPAPITVLESAPFFLQQPAQDNRAFLGMRFALAASASGSGPLGFQWQFNGQDIPGATSDELIFERPRLTNSGNYTLVVSNSFGAVTSLVAKLTVVQVVAWGAFSTNVPPTLTNAIAIAATAFASVALRADGTVTAWDSIPAGTNVPPDLSNVVEVARGRFLNFALALKGNGTVAVWGDVTSAFSNAVASLSNIVSIDASPHGVMFLRPNGTVVGYDGSVISGLTNVVALEGNDDGYGALQADGTVFTCCGLFVPSPSSNVLAFANQRYHGKLLTRDGTVWESRFPFFPAMPVASNMIAVAADAAVRSDGTAVTWTDVGFPQFANIPPGLGNVGAIDSSTYNIIALLVLRDFPLVLLPDALDTPALVVSSRNSAQWFGQATVSHDGVDAGQSAELDRNTASSMRMLVAGPITISFWWKVSSETNHDFLSFSIGGVPQEGISGETGWQQRAFNVPPGNQMLVWTYSKDAAGTVGQDAGWVDELTLIPHPPSILMQPVSQNVVGGTNVNVTFNVAATGTPPLIYRWEKDGTTIPGATTTSLRLTNVTRSHSGAYSAMVTNTAGSVTSSNAILVVHVPQRLGSPLLQPDGTFLLNSVDADGGSLTPADLANLDVQVSSNLVDWISLPGALSVTNGQLELRDAGTPGQSVRFYRIVESW